MTTAIEQARSTIVQYKGELVASLPSHLAEKGQGWLSSALAALRRDDYLLKAANQNPGSLITALSQAAQMGLMPGTDEYYLTPRFGKNPGVVGIAGYQGEIELMYRAGAVSSVIVENVFANDKFSYVPGRDEKPIHEVDWFASSRGPIKLSYAYGIMKDGAVSKVVIVNQERIDRAKEASSTAGKSHSPWASDEAAMWLKTAAHDLAKWVPTSAEYIREQVRAAKEVAAEVPAPAPQQQQPQQQTPAAPQAAPEPRQQQAQQAPEHPVNEFEDMGETIPGEWEEPPAEPQQSDAAASQAQIRMVASMLTKHGHKTTTEKVDVLRQITGRDNIEDLTDLTKREASGVIEEIQRINNTEAADA